MPPPSHYWPDHWYFDQDHIRCIVPHCGFVTPSDGLLKQWTQIDDHCKDVPDADHKILERMLRQSICAIDDCGHHSNDQTVTSRIRPLFAHETSVHGSEDMSHLFSFVRLAREGRICSGPVGVVEKNCERLTFERMLEKVIALPDAMKNMLFERSGYRNPMQKTRKNMGKILTADPLAQEWEEPPYWWPVRADYFLKLIRPNPSNPADHEWAIVWRSLREAYAEGRI